MTTFPSQSKQTLEMYKRLKMFSFTLYNRTVEDKFPTGVESVLLFLVYFYHWWSQMRRKKKIEVLLFGTWSKMKMNNADDSHVDGATSGCRCTAGWSTGPAWLHLLHPWPPAGPLPGHEGSSRLRWPTPPGLWTCWPHCHGRSYESESEKKSQFSRAFCVRRRVFYVFGTQWHLVYHHDVETIIGSNKNKQMQRFFAFIYSRTWQGHHLAPWMEQCTCRRARAS